MTLPTTMRAVQYTEYGASNVLTINQVPVPTPGPGEVLVRVQAFSVNRVDAPFYRQAIPQRHRCGCAR